ncbi:MULTISPECIES: MATE family efflux transporter [Dethiosulfovibrio]|uniref:Multidrug export protein MepA n=2 Tax=Dethiosulfovibrio TaxID=47054 RepID=A0ABS9ES82_9BACT|nr:MULTISPECIES: MATE family efflux transporter [Dethiosulfovibrio]MCF4114439.1 MATE family efflux transporter [Dethiosulfovibrio russensis]MCF4143116.1 MATE family efflux transporter [Dethiosulfovibrio marinus]MCF4146129.1 MATE family efflux transporter [Dethiosulfovibrio acidaminovorans]
MKDRTEFLGKEPVGRLLAKLSIPAMTGMLVMASYNVADTIFVGRGVGPLGLGAIASAFPIQFIVHALAMMVGVGAASLVSRSLGAGDSERAETALGNAFFMAMVAGLFVSAAGRLSMPTLVALTGAPSELAPLIRDYLGTIFLGSSLLVCGMTMNCVIRSEGSAKVAMMSLILSAVTNIALDPIFIFVLKMGVTGAAIATVIAQGVTFVWAIAHYLVPGRSSVRLHTSNLRPRWSILKEIMTVGGSEFARLSAQSVAGVLILNRLSFYGGTDAMAAQGIVQKMLSLSIMPIFGIAQGLQPIVGYAYGAGDNLRAKKAVEMGLISASIISLATSALLLTIPGPLVRVFTDSPALIDTTKSFIRVAISMYFVVGFQIIGTATFQSLGFSRPSMVLSLSRQVLLLIPLALILPPYLGLLGVFLVYPTADVASAALTMWLLARYRKRLIPSQAN